MNLRMGLKSQRDQSSFHEYTECRVKNREVLEKVFNIQPNPYVDLKHAYEFEDELNILKQAMERKIGYELTWYEWEEANGLLMKSHCNNGTIFQRYELLARLLNCPLPTKIIKRVQHYEACAHIKEVEQQVKTHTEVLTRLQSQLIEPMKEEPVNVSGFILPGPNVGTTTRGS